jgi:hypothetical protein
MKRTLRPASAQCDATASCLHFLVHRTLLKPCCISDAVRLFLLLTSITSNAEKKLSKFERAAVLFANKA